MVEGCLRPALGTPEVEDEGAGHLTADLGVPGAGQWLCHGVMVSDYVVREGRFRRAVDGGEGFSTTSSVAVYSHQWGYAPRLELVS